MHYTQGGVLVFFPSYRLMEHAVERWKHTGLYVQLQDVMKHVILEPRASKGIDQKNGAQNWKNNKKNKQKQHSKLSYGEDDSDDELRKPAKTNFMLQDQPVKPKKVVAAGGEEEEEDEVTYQNMVAEFDSTIARHGRCLLLAVCRGKVSEGIDFSNNKGRVVIITGASRPSCCHKAYLLTPCLCV